MAVVDDLERGGILPLHERHQILVGESLQVLYLHIGSLIGHGPDLPIYAGLACADQPNRDAHVKTRSYHVCDPVRADLRKGPFKGRGSREAARRKPTEVPKEDT